MWRVCSLTPGSYWILRLDECARTDFFRKERWKWTQARQQWRQNQDRVRFCWQLSPRMIVVAQTNSDAFDGLNAFVCFILSNDVVGLGQAFNGRKETVLAEFLNKVLCVWLCLPDSEEIYTQTLAGAAWALRSKYPFYILKLWNFFQH